MLILALVLVLALPVFAEEKEEESVSIEITGGEIIFNTNLFERMTTERENRDDSSEGELFSLTKGSHELEVEVKGEAINGLLDWKLTLDDGAGLGLEVERGFEDGFLRVNTDVRVANTTLWSAFN